MNVRELSTPQDYRECETLQRLTWGSNFQEVVPPAVLKISQKVGGIVAGAFADEGEMVGFVFGITGWRNREPCHWSHMMAVKTKYRDQGIGKTLKDYQRSELMKAGVGRMYWTYDPLVARNAHLNLNKLGAAISEYVPHMYGSDDENSLDHVIGTDRFIVDWDLHKPNLVSPDTLRFVEPTNAKLQKGEDPAVRAFERCDHDTVGIAIPQDIHALKRREPAKASAWRASTREAIQYYSESGYTIAGFRTEPEYLAGVYILTKQAGHPGS